MPETTDTNQNLHARAKQGIQMLMGRQVLLQVLTFAGGVVLARQLGPGPVGLYIIANFLVSMFALVGDFGVAPSFIQKKAELTNRELQVGFTIQQALTTLIVLLLFALGPWLTHFYPKAPPATVWLIRALSLNLYVTSWRSMSALQLERHLRYDRLARIEVLEALIYQGVAVGMALSGKGTWSFVAAVLASGLTGAVLVYCAAPWRIQLAFDKRIAREIFKFGVPFQLQTISNSLGGWLSPVFVGSLVGPQGVGYLTWASSNGKKPLMLVDNIMRVAYPHFSRIQDDRAEVERLLTRYLTYLILAAGLWFSLLLIAGPALVHLIYTDKWAAAVPALVLYAAALAPDMIGWVVGVTLNSLGLVNFTTRVVLVKSIANIGLCLPLVFWLGFLGVPISYLVTSIVTLPWMLCGLGIKSVLRVSASLAWLAVPILAGSLVGEVLLKSHLPLLLKVATALSLDLVAFVISLWLLSPNWLRGLMEKNLSNRQKMSQQPKPSVRV